MQNATKGTTNAFRARAPGASACAINPNSQASSTRRSSRAGAVARARALTHGIWTSLYICMNSLAASGPPHRAPSCDPKLSTLDLTGLTRYEYSLPFCGTPPDTEQQTVSVRRHATPFVGHEPLTKRSKFVWTAGKNANKVVNQDGRQLLAKRRGMIAKHVEERDTWSSLAVRSYAKPAGLA